MQEKEQNITSKKQNNSPIKHRILQYIEYLGISKRDFYAKTMISRGTLESSTGITEEIIARFIATYQNISPVWLLTGEGAMTTDKKGYNSVQDNDQILRESGSASYTCKSCAEKDKIIEVQEDYIRTLKKVIDTLAGGANASHISQTG